MLEKMSWESQIMFVFSYDTFLENIKTLKPLIYLMGKITNNFVDFYI